MDLGKQIANQFREVQLSGKWVVTTNLKAELIDLTWEQATTKIGSLNTIADLTFHLNYYVAGVLNVLKGGSLDIRDKYSFNTPPIESQKEWEKLLNKMMSDAEKFADLLEQLPDEKILGDFVEKQYGNYYKNIHALIEHSYYHLGQIVMIKKMLSEELKGSK